MPKGQHLGEFEQLVLLGLASVSDDAEGRSIYEEILRATGRDVSITAVHVTLSRLERKGYVSSQFSRPAATAGGRPRKLYRLQPSGAAALKTMRQTHEQLWEGARLHPRLRGS